MEIITRKRTVWLTFLDVLYKKKLPLQSIHAKGVPFFVTPVRFKRTSFCIFQVSGHLYCLLLYQGF